jgi:mycofactocin precursor
VGRAESAFSATGLDRTGPSRRAGIVPASEHGGTMAAETTTDAPADEILVEEISVDGMCGVY